MTRSQQHAMWFLLGALLVGGVAGFSASSWFHAKTKAPSWAAREGMYDDLGLTPQQRQTIDSVTDVAVKQMHQVFAPVQIELDSLRNDSRKTIESIMTPTQRAKYDQRVKEAQERQAKVQAHRDSLARAQGKDPATTHGIRPIL